MKIECWAIGKTAFDYVKVGMSLYEKRLKHYCLFDFVVLPDVKNPPLSSEALKAKEAEIILSKLEKDDFLVLLDERGKQFSSVEFSQWLEKQQLNGKKRVIFLIGGAFGFAQTVYDRSNAQISLSRMTFSHQMIRLFFIEQLYRAFTILKNEKYHNE